MNLKSSIRQTKSIQVLLLTGWKHYMNLSFTPRIVDSKKRNISFKEGFYYKWLSKIEYSCEVLLASMSLELCSTAQRIVFCYFQIHIFHITDKCNLSTCKYLYLQCLLKCTKCSQLFFEKNCQNWQEGSFQKQSRKKIWTFFVLNYFCFTAYICINGERTSSFLLF